MSPELARIDHVLRSLREAGAHVGPALEQAAQSGRAARERLAAGAYLDNDEIASALDAIAASATLLREISMVAVRLCRTLETANDAAINLNFARAYATVN